jgi:hypothetical protein
MNGSAARIQKSVIIIAFMVSLSAYVWYVAPFYLYFYYSPYQEFHNKIRDEKFEKETQQFLQGEIDRVADFKKDYGDIIFGYMPPVFNFEEDRMLAEVIFAGSMRKNVQCRSTQEFGYVDVRKESIEVNPDIFQTRISSAQSNGYEEEKIIIINSKSASLFGFQDYEKNNSRMIIWSTDKFAYSMRTSGTMCASKEELIKMAEGIQ